MTLWLNLWRFFVVKQYSDDEWGMINSLLERNPALFGVPERREKSIVMAS
jgi:hypothetical protein